MVFINLLFLNVFSQLFLQGRFKFRIFAVYAFGIILSKKFLGRNGYKDVISARIEIFILGSHGLGIEKGL